MRRAITLSQRNADPTRTDPPVAAVVVDPDGTIIGEGWHSRAVTGDPTVHAEIIALRNAARVVGEWRLEGCTVVTTLEPGPMSAGALILARIKRLVIGSWDPIDGAVCSQWDLVRDYRLNHRIEVIAEVLDTETDALIEDYLNASRLGCQLSPSNGERGGI